MKQTRLDEDKIRLTHIVFSLDMGGLEKLVVELANRVDKSRFITSVCCLTKEGTLSQELVKNGIKVFYFNKQGGVDLFLPFRIARLLKKEKIDIVHTHDSSANLYGSVAGKLAGVKVIINTEHGGIYFETRRKRLINRILCLLNDREICVSNNVKKDLLSMGLSSKRLTVIHNGIDFDRFDLQMDKNNIRKGFGFNNSDFIITTIGRLSGEKNQIMLLEVVKPILEKIPEARFTITGRGPLRKDLQEYAVRLQVAEKVVFLGERDDVAPVLKMSDCFVLCSNYESFGLTILEAMAAGIPVIATDVGGVKEIVNNGETGILVPKDNKEELTRAIIAIKSDPLFAAQIALQAKEMVKNNYGIEAMVKEHENLYLSRYRKQPLIDPAHQTMRVLTFGLDNRALLEGEGHSKRWNSRIGKHVDKLDVIVEMKEKIAINEKWISDNVRILPIYVPHPMLYPFIAYRKAMEEHKKQPYDLVTTEEPFRTGLAGWLLKRKTGIALSVEYHNDTFYNRQWLNERPISHRIFIIVGRIVIRYADSVRCVCRKNLLELKRLCRNDHEKLMEIIPVPTEFYDTSKHSAGSAEIRKRLLKDINGLLLLFVGRLVSVKKVDELISAFCEVRKSYRNASLAIVGDGPEFSRLDKLAIGCAKNGIIFTGYVPEDEVFKYYGASDIFINPSHNETYGRIYVEAMSAGKPVITTSGVGAVEDKLCVNNVNSLVIKPGDIDELKAAIIRLIEDSSLRKRLGENALKDVKGKFDYENTLMVMKNFWEKTIQIAREKK